MAFEDGVPPAFVTWSRVALGARPLVPLAWRAGTLRALRGRNRWPWAYGAGRDRGAFALFA
jgi:hypothetical protein